MRRTLDLYSPVSGYVTQKMAIHGMRVTPVDTLFDIADLSHLWVLADVYESDLPAVRVGMPRGAGPLLPARAAPGAASVTYIAPDRRGEDPHGQGPRGGRQRGRPAQAGDVRRRGAPRPRWERAWWSRRARVIDRRESARSSSSTAATAALEPREVQLGAKVGDGVEVLSGLADGEDVVTGANFLLDSESSLKAALAAHLGRAPAAAPGQPGHRH